MADQPISTPPQDFLFVCCQVGAERALKADLAQHHPQLAFAFSRPGFVTFKRRDDSRIDSLRSPFARTFGFHLAQFREANPSSAIATCLAEASLPVTNLPVTSQQAPFQALHVWQRDQHVPGDRGFEPLTTDASREFGEQIREQAAATLGDLPINERTKHDARIADVIRVDEEHWFIGWHRASAPASRWPGGVPLLKIPDDMISRAYLKMQEALYWSQLPIEPDDVCAELGSSPGGACQALLRRGLRVIGIDPALMDERVLSHPNFTHLRARAADLKRKEFADVRWLMADANIAPTNTLDAVEAIVTHRQVRVEGMLLTLKLLDWSMASEIDDYVNRIREWGYRHIRVRQLAFNRREICVFAAKRKIRR